MKELFSSLSLFLWFQLIVNVHSRCTSCNITTNDFEILYSIFQSTNGGSWSYNTTDTNSSRWNFSGDPTSDPCKDNWYGITCSACPTSYSDYCPVTKINLASSNMSGNLPSDIWNLRNLTVIDLSYNTIAGPIPSNIGTAAALIQINFNNNNLNSTVPSSIFNLLNIQEVYLSSNKLTGPIPDNIGNATTLIAFDLNSNWLTGSVPDSLRLLVNIETIGLDNNKLSGSLPYSVFVNLARLKYLNLAYNSLTGSAAGFAATSSTLLYSIVTLNISFNFFGGQIPEYKNLNNLTYLALNNNILSGTVPSNLGLLTNLEYLYLQANINPSGPIPTSLGKLKKLKTIVMSNNNFSQSLDGIFDPQGQDDLLCVDFSGNTLTGTIPSEIFQLPNIQRITLGKNCLRGPLPSTVCNATKLIALRLNSLGGLYGNTVNASSKTEFNEACPSQIPYQIPVNGGLFTNLAFSMIGTIPDCLLSLPDLQALYLAGNGFTGTIPEVVGANLTNLSLAYNHLTATIPNGIQEKTNFQFLDLAFNRLTGVLQPGFELATETSSIKLNNNQLSGQTPESFNSIHSGYINVLSGNSFYNTEYSLPPNDPSYGVYVSGSDQLDIAFYILGSIVVFVLCWVAFCIHSLYAKWLSAGNQLEPTSNACMERIRRLALTVRRIMLRIVVWLAIANPAEPDEALQPTPFKEELSGCVVLLLKLRNVGVPLSIAITVVGFVLYPALKFGCEGATTHVYSYGWIVTLAYTNGVVVVWVTFCCFMILVVALVYSLILRSGFVLDGKVFSQDAYADAFRDAIKRDDAIVARRSLAHWARHSLLIILTVTMNIVVVLTVNIVYVVDIANSFSQDVLWILQILLSLFKLSWNYAAIPIMVGNCCRLTSILALSIVLRVCVVSLQINAIIS